MTTPISILRALIHEQALDEGLWSVPAEGTQRIAEAYLQQELRKLHEAVENVFAYWEAKEINDQKEN